MKYRFLEDIATADIAFEAYGETLNQLFENAALALTAVMVDVATIRPIEKREIKLVRHNLEFLLIDFLNEIVFIKDKEALIFNQALIEVTKDQLQGNYSITGTMVGERINPQRHRLRSDVKAVTWHMFQLLEEKDNYRARVVLDI